MRHIASILALCVLQAPVAGAQEQSQRSFSLQGGISLARQNACDPFGQFDTVCAHSTGLAGTVEAGDRWWHLQATGGNYHDPFNGQFADASLRGRLLAIGQTRFGIILATEHRDWTRNVFTGELTRLDTSRSAHSGFVGLDAGIGDYHRGHVRLVLLAGHWMSTYHTVLTFDGFSGEQRLAYDEFSLGRLRLEAANIPIGDRVRISGSAQRTWAYFTQRRFSASPVVPTKEWVGTFGVAVRAWRPKPRLSVDLTLHARIGEDRPSLTQDTGTRIGLVVRFN